MTHEPPKRPLKDRVLDRVPVFGRLRRVKGWVRRNKGWIYFAIALAVLFIVKPVLDIVAQVVKVFQPAVQALFDNPVGRFVFYNVLAILLLWWVWRRVSKGVRRMVGLYVMRAFLDGMHLMFNGHWRAAIPRFERVVRWRRWVRLPDAVPEHRDIGADARIKIATCHHKLGEVNEALRWLHTVRQQDMLTEHVRRSHAELRALTYDLSDELEGETVLRELAKTEQRDRKNRRILGAYRDRLEAAGEIERARDVHKRLLAVAEGLEKDQAERDLARLEFRVAHKALLAGSSADTRKGLGRALKAHPGDVRSALLLGDMRLQEGDVKGALKAWSRAVGVAVFDRLARLLQSGQLQDNDVLLDQFPYVGTLLVLAEHYRRKGDFRRARSALDKVLETVGESAPVMRLYAACLEGEGDAEGAAALYRRALLQLS
ncbi:MAG: tetratricopeptide repeat protein [Planctomycetota bacterium]|nr:tetratricopeptide repeat protein [Planctomycetota bacterium]